jgi:thiopeptide-type bacteriocin biosynthesis protein
MTQALPAAMTWAAGLIAAGRLSRAGLAVYEREVERYGGPSGISLAELVFAADSIAVAAMLAELRGALDLMEMAVLSVDHLLAGLGLDEAARLRWYRDAAPPPVESGTAYRQRGRRLRELLGHPGADPASAAVLDILARRTAELAPIGARLNDLADAGQLNSPVTTIARSLVHLHCNRLGVDSASERVLLGLLQRTRVSLVAAPLP